MNIPEYTAAMTAQAEKLILGKRDRIRLILMALLAEGHILLDDLPGVGKTTLVKALALASGCEAKRVQFVPDLLPATYEMHRLSAAVLPSLMDVSEWLQSR